MLPETQEITVGQAIIDAARANGMTTIFGVPGAQIYPLFDGLYGSGVELIVPRHEQAAGYMAMGYAKSTGRTGVFAVVPGPGVLNAGAALCTAMGNCAPVVCLTGQVPSSYLGRGRGHLHELADQRATLKTFIKDAWRIDTPADVVPTVNRAFRAAQSGRPGPVAVETCWDTLAAAASRALAPPEVAQQRAGTRLRRHRRCRKAARCGSQTDADVRRRRTARRGRSARAGRDAAGAGDGISQRPRRGARRSRARSRSRRRSRALGRRGRAGRHRQPPRDAVHALARHAAQRAAARAAEADPHRYRSERAATLPGRRRHRGRLGHRVPCAGAASTAPCDAGSEPAAPRSLRPNARPRR